MNRVRQTIHVPSAILEKNTESVGVGVLDSGIFLHEDFRSEKLFFKDFVNHRSYAYDDSGHGTHICGIIGGSGSCSSGKYKGIAPFANLYVGKILDAYGGGSVSALLKGMDWLLNLNEINKVRVINISISSVHFKKEYEYYELMNLFQYAFMNNILVVVSAGNSGPELRSISRLGDSEYCICTGCYDKPEQSLKTDLCQNYSARGPGIRIRRKPDLVAPGSSIVSCNIRSKSYISKSGTSMSTAVVSGVLAGACAVFPKTTSFELKRKLLLSAESLYQNEMLQGFGMVNMKNLFELLEG